MDNNYDGHFKRTKIIIGPMIHCFRVYSYSMPIYLRYNDLVYNYV